MIVVVHIYRGLEEKLELMVKSLALTVMVVVGAIPNLIVGPCRTLSTPCFGRREKFPPDLLDEIIQIFVTTCTVKKTAREPQKSAVKRRDYRLTPSSD